MPQQPDHDEIIAGRLKYLLQAIQAAEANSVDWPVGLVNSFRKWSKDKITVAGIVGKEIEKAALEMSVDSKK